MYINVNDNIMSEEYFESAIHSLQKYQDPHRLLKILVVIRKEIEWPRNRNNMQKLRDKGCLKQVVMCLHTKNGNILDVTLSILGNCCMDSDTAKDLVCLNASALQNNFIKY